LVGTNRYVGINFCIRAFMVVHFAFTTMWLNSVRAFGHSSIWFSASQCTFSVPLIIASTKAIVSADIVSPIPEEIIFSLSFFLIGEFILGRRKT
jgi:hypothetical protein